VCCDLKGWLNRARDAAEAADPTLPRGHEFFGKRPFAAVEAKDGVSDKAARCSRSGVWLKARKPIRQGPRPSRRVATGIPKLAIAQLDN